jgi:adenylate kinase family enzyme
VQRIAIVGSGGAGKSMLARQIGAIAGLPVIHLDHQYWSPGWVPMPDDEWVAHQRKLLAGTDWVVDGNYAATLELRAELADTVVFLDLPRHVCLVRAMRRFRSPILQAPGCPQKVDVEFLRWIWEFPSRSRPRLLAILGTYSARCQIVQLRSAAEVRAFLAGLRSGTVHLGPVHRR